MTRVFQYLLLSIALLFFVPTAFADGDPRSIKTAKGAKVSEPLGDFELIKYQYCGSDKDCRVAQNGCCDCANGGQDIAINKKDIENFRARFSCLRTTCTSRARTPACGSGVVSCINHRCQYFEPEQIKLDF